MIKPKVVLLIFVSGKIVLTGAKVKFFSFFDFFDVSSTCLITLLAFMTNTSDGHAMMDTMFYDSSTVDSV